MLTAWSKQDRARSTALPLLLVALLVAGPVVTCSFSSTASAGMEEEAERQLGFARRELSEGRFTRAVASAESALRLNPAAYEAFLIKALAYEQLGELELASSLLVACQEITKGMDQDPRAAEALARIRAARDGGAGRPARSRSDESEVAATRVESEPVPAGPIDIESYQERVKQAITTGSCAVAMATASELTMRAPRDPGGFRLVGDAARCAGQGRPAVVAYRRYQALGGDDSKVGLMLRGLVENLSVLSVLVERQEGGPVPRVHLALPQGEVLSPEQDRGDSLVFSDLPAGLSLALTVAGHGLEPLDVEVEPLAPGETRTLEIHPVYVGMGTVRIAAHDPALCTTTLITADGEAGVAPGGSERVTAGEFTARVSGEHGEVDVSLEVPPNGELTFDPSSWIPTSLTVVDLPTGSEVRIFIDGFGNARLERTETVPLFGGRIDTETGVRLADPLLIQSLIGGSGGIFVSHPLLGEGAGSVVLEPGSVNATTFDWPGMDGVGRVSEPYQRWSHQRTELQRKVRGQTAAPAVLAIGSAVASGLMFALAADAERRLTETAESLEVDLNQAALQQRTGFLIAGGVTASTAVIGFVITGGVGARGKRTLDACGDWDPISAQEEE